MKSSGQGDFSQGSPGDEEQPPAAASSGGEGEGGGLEAKADQGQLFAALQHEARLSSSFGALYSNAVAEKVGMHSTDIETMDLLHTMGPMTAGQLSALSGLSTGATTRLIDRLERAGFVRRVPDSADRRRVIIEVIPENVGRIGDLFEPMRERLVLAWARFSPQEIETILRFFRECNIAVSEANAELRGRPAGGSGTVGPMGPIGPLGPGSKDRE